MNRFLLLFLILLITLPLGASLKTDVGKIKEEKNPSVENNESIKGYVDRDDKAEGRQEVAISNKVKKEGITIWNDLVYREYEYGVEMEYNKKDYGLILLTR